MDWYTDAYRACALPLAEVLGAQAAKAFEALRVHTVGDLLTLIPRRYFKGTELTDLASVLPGEDVAVEAAVKDVDIRRSHNTGREWLSVTLTDGRGTMEVTFFHPNIPKAPKKADSIFQYWTDNFSRAKTGMFIGKVGEFNGQLQMSHPTYVIFDAQGKLIGTDKRDDSMAKLTEGGLVGIYPASAKLPTWKIAECARIALDTFPDADPLPEWVVEAAGVVGEHQAYEYVHRPRSEDDGEVGAYRLRFDEAFATQLTMAYRRADAANQQATVIQRREDGLLASFDAKLPFSLTDGQIAVSETIFEELSQPRPMQRLLQGEVGSGKTVVALRAMLAAVDAGAQAVLIAPTEVLAHQHYHTITSMMGELAEPPLFGSTKPGTDVSILTGSLSAVAKRNAALRIASGEAGIVIGTHALLNDKITFANLGLVVIDEQHRFGVEQRAAIANKAAHKPHVLVLTATPIPRSVAMTIFGDLEVSTLRELPKGRADVQTVLVDAAKPAWMNRTWERIREEVEHGRQAFVVCPRIGDPKHRKKSEGPGVIELAAQLAEGPLRGLRIGVLHGKLPSEEKDAVMEDFASGKIDVLVTTTVIEVGVDVPNATVMVVMEADRFGVSQLHQLRGRIGRGQYPGLALLCADIPEPEKHVETRERLAAIAATRDGFELAELDLVQRREGDVLGERQSGGRSSLRLLRVLEHADVIAKAREIAELAVARDPNCETPGFKDAVKATEMITDTELVQG
ncbi:MAG: ATP-dependent DNA helicase RecG [Propionibacteriaceae bacterium]|jgi:ATP-dependent DNA helicase RecG|nr:ATP-dependent DNA helicase RecG [Propionibacteriaceae bacterium]